MVKKYLCTILFMVISTVNTSASSWGTPEVITVYSQNNEYMLRVYPTKLPNNRYSYKYRRQLKKGIADTIVVPTHAVLYRISNSDTIEVWNKPLVNRQSPVNAIVANDGKSIITVGNWYSAVYEHTFVIYGGEEGELIIDFELEEISPFPVQHYRGMSSINWVGNVEYLNNDRVEILFRNEKGEEQKRIFNIKTRAFE